MAEKSDVLQFMLVRAPAELAEDVVLRRCIRDSVVDAEHGRQDSDLFSTLSHSWIGKLVYESVFCPPAEPPPPSTPAAAAQALVDALVGQLPNYTPGCPNEGGPLGLEVLQSRPHIVRGDTYHLLPVGIDDLEGEMIGALPGLLEELRRAARPDTSNGGKPPDFDEEQLLDQIRAVLRVDVLYKAMFDDGEYNSAYGGTRRALFDRLYHLYILRRTAGIDLAPVMAGLRALHALEALAFDEVIRRAVKQGNPDQYEAFMLQALQRMYPRLVAWDYKSWPAPFPLVPSRDRLREYLDATPVVHPLFARLHRLRAPFSDLRPLGVGDLKVVKQWLRGYRLGEIAHIDNVMQSELRTRVHRHLEKTEDVFSSVDEQVVETQRDTQTTDRFELKREAENVVKTDMNVNAGLNVNATVQGTGYTVVTGVTGGFAHTSSTTEEAKVASNFARDVVDKAVKRIQSRVSRTRTTTRISETEETNTHAFDNKAGDGHISGIYHWVDKEYESQIYNYGKRMMFEFILPEPAAFLVESRLRAYQAELDVPQPPAPPAYEQIPEWAAKLAPADITPERFGELRKLYDLDDLSYPVLTRKVEFVDSATGRNYFSERGIDPTTWQARSFTCRLGAKGYRLTKLIVDGYVKFIGTEGDLVGDPDPSLPSEINTMELSVDGQRLIRHANNKFGNWYLGGNLPSEYVADGQPLVDDQVSLSLGFWDVDRFDLSVHGEVALSAQALEDWQNRVCSVVRDAEGARVAAVNDELRQSYQSQLSTYRNRLAELKATAVNDLLQGQSEAHNRQVILRELKRQSLAMLTKEFDADLSDDLLTDLDATGERQVGFHYRRLDVVELPNATNPVHTEANFTLVEQPVPYPVPDVALARRKGRYVQFLEQAFEWQQLTYLCYPYFWAPPPEWVQLMSRNDATDPFFTAFLQAGSARVLLAVTPAYENAILHYLASGEPWEGGQSPVIGDPLHIPLHEELHRQQDDLAGAVPEGEPWTFTLPTSLVYLRNSSTELPPLDAGD